MNPQRLALGIVDGDASKAHMRWMKYAGEGGWENLDVFADESLTGPRVIIKLPEGHPQHGMSARFGTPHLVVRVRCLQRRGLAATAIAAAAAGAKGGGAKAAAAKK